MNIKCPKAIQAFGHFLLYTIDKKVETHRGQYTEYETPYRNADSGPDSCADFIRTE